MSNNPLKDHIAEIRAIMEDSLASKERDLIGDILSGIVKGPAELPKDELASVTEKIDAAAVDFEMDHPKLARALREVGDTLNKMGV